MRHLKVSLNRRQHLLTLSLCLLLGQLMMSTDARGIDWYGVGSPEICFTGKFTEEGLLKDDAQLRVTVDTAYLVIKCDNSQHLPEQFCQGGSGNEGAAVVTDLCTKANPADCTTGPDNPGVDNQILSGCIDLSKWFDHAQHPNSTYHICNPTANTNLIEITRSGRVVALSGSYTLIRSSSATKEQTAGTGTFSCTWPGTVNPVGCQVDLNDPNNDCCQATQDKCFTCTQTCYDGKGKKVDCETVPSVCVP
jgi:hypothetical protein